MGLRNTREDFGSGAKLFHWIIAGLIILAYVLVYSAHWAVEDRSPEWRFLVRSHRLVGFFVGVLVLPRLIWRLLDPRPAEAAGSALEHGLARLTHWVLYALMIAMPLTGWMGGSLPIDLGWVKIPPFQQTGLYDLIVVRGLGLDWKQFEPLADWFHKDFAGRWVLWGLVALHIAAALFHHVVRRDRTLVAMLPWGSGRSSDRP